MKILLVYASYSGTTFTVANMIKDTLIQAKFEVTIKTAQETIPEDFQLYDAVILGSCTWELEGKDGQLHADFVTLINKFEGKTFAGKKFAVFGLGDSSYVNFCRAADYLEEFITKLQGTKIIDSLRIDNFYMNQDENTQKIKSWNEELLIKLNT